jgi:ABC-type Fe3+/spermidine/putrescine transport system ATPase subunit
VLRVRDLRLVYRSGRERVDAVASVSFTVAPGAFYTLLGPSGCGKTSTLRCIAGLETPTAGSIEIGETVVFSGEPRRVVPPYRRDTGMVFQSYAIWPHMTVFENVAFPLRHGRQKLASGIVRERVMRVLDLVGLASYAARPAPLLSGGQQQRVALARALAREPAVLLLDEPLSNLDTKLRESMRDQIRTLVHRLGITTLYVTHDQEEALSISDHVAVMYGGRIEQMGSPAEMYSSPATPFVAEFIGTMNRFEGTVVDGGVDHGGTRLAIEAAQGRPRGQRVLVLVRPETVEVGPTNGDGAANTLVGDVVTQTFLGPVTRLKIVGSGVDVIADVPTQKALGLPVGTRVAAVLPAEGVRLLELRDDLPELAEEPLPTAR